MSKILKNNFILIVLGLAALFPLHIQAQLTRGRISGTIQDESGAVVPGATINRSSNWH